MGDAGSGDEGYAVTRQVAVESYKGAMHGVRKDISVAWSDGCGRK